MKKKIILGIILLFSAIQFIGIDKSVPEYDPADNYLADFSGEDQIQTLLVQACFDCHSYETDYPWYANVAPVSWWLQSHVRNARRSLNFSDWQNYSDEKKSHKKDECVEYIKKAWMPPASYKLAHPEARLTDEERAVLAAHFDR